MVKEYQVIQHWTCMYDFVVQTLFHIFTVLSFHIFTGLSLLKLTEYVVLSL